jgi:hypothetical protein
MKHFLSSVVLNVTFSGLGFSVFSLLFHRVDLDIAQTVEKKVSEIRESTIRERNIIIYGISETNDKIPAVRKESDTRYVEQLTNCLAISRSTRLVSAATLFLDLIIVCCYLILRPNYCLLLPYS